MNMSAARLTALFTAGAALTAAANASANNYAVVQSGLITNGDADDGAAVELWTGDLRATCNGSQKDFVNHEFWYSTEANWGSTIWIEEGFKAGLADNPNQPCWTNVFFWADSRPIYGYSEHEVSSAEWAFGQWEPLVINMTTHPNGCEWAINLNGTVEGYSTSNCPSVGRWMQAGIETTNPGQGNARGWAGNFQELDSNWQWLPMSDPHIWDSTHLCQNTSQDFTNCDSSTDPEIEGYPPNTTWSEEVQNDSFE
jgi:hypothetical protein